MKNTDLRTNRNPRDEQPTADNHRRGLTGCGHREVPLLRKRCELSHGLTSLSRWRISLTGKVSPVAIRSAPVRTATTSALFCSSRLQITVSIRMVKGCGGGTGLSFVIPSTALPRKFERIAGRRLTSANRPLPQMSRN